MFDQDERAELVGLHRENAEIRLDGKFPIIVQPGVGSIDVDVLGPTGGHIAVDRTAKAANTAKRAPQLDILKYSAGEAGMPGQAYRGTRRSAIDLARKTLGDGNVSTAGPCSR